MQVLQTLRLNLVCARQWRERAAKAFRDSTEAGGGVHSDADLIRQAATEYTRALQAAEDALRKHNDFVRHGTVPPELDLGA